MRVTVGSCVHEVRRLKKARFKKETLVSSPPNGSSTRLNETPSNRVTQPSTSTEGSLSNPHLLQTQLQTISRLLEIQNQNRLPLPEPGLFTGDPLKYPVG